MSESVSPDTVSKTVSTESGAAQVVAPTNARKREELTLEVAVSRLRVFFDYDTSHDSTPVKDAMIFLRTHHRDNPEVLKSFLLVLQDERFLGQMNNQRSPQRSVLLLSLGILGSSAAAATELLAFVSAQMDWPSLAQHAKQALDAIRPHVPDAATADGVVVENISAQAPSSATSETIPASTL